MSFTRVKYKRQDNSFVHAYIFKVIAKMIVKSNDTIKNTGIKIRETMEGKESCQNQGKVKVELKEIECEEPTPLHSHLVHRIRYFVAQSPPPLFPVPHLVYGIRRFVAPVAQQLLDTERKIVRVVVGAEFLPAQDKVKYPGSVGAAEESGVHVEPIGNTGVKKGGEIRPTYGTNNLTSG